MKRSAGDQIVTLGTGVLSPHPDQDAIYGAVGDGHDLTFGEFIEDVKRQGVIQPLIVSRGTPGLPDNTIISGHRRWYAARYAKFGGVPCIPTKFESVAHAKEAMLASNRQRVKDEWVKTQEAVAWREVESALAAQRKAHGTTAPGKNAYPDRRDERSGSTVEKVAERLDEGATKTQVRFRLAEAAATQNPENPSASPIAEDLRAGLPVNTVAKRHGVKPGDSRPAKTEEPVEDIAPPSPLSIVPPSTSTGETPAEEEKRAKAITRLCAQFEERLAELVAIGRIDAITHPSLRGECFIALRRVIDAASRRLPASERKGAA